jgi:hypothetical protein
VVALATVQSAGRASALCLHECCCAWRCVRGTAASSAGWLRGEWEGGAKGSSHFFEVSWKMFCFVAWADRASWN